MVLTVCYDPGTSLTKILYEKDPTCKESDSSGDRVKHVKYMTIAPEVISLPVESKKKLPSRVGLGKPQDNAWVQLSEDGDCYAVGRTAIDSSATVSINQLKHVSLIPKILAAVGAIAELEKLGNNFPINLSLLIPYGELGNEDQIEEELRESLESFYFREQRMSVQLQRYLCISEGSGIALNYARRLGFDKFREKTIAFLMLGYRNTSMLLFREGTLSKKASCTTQLGFIDFIDKFRASVPTISREQVQDILWLNQNSFEATSEQLSERLQVKSDSILSSFRSSLAEYWNLLDVWLSEVLPFTEQLDCLVSCGGTVDFVSQQLQEKFGNKLDRFKESEKDLFSALQLDLKQVKRFDNQNLAVRFADCWGAYVKFANYPIDKLSKRPVLV